MVILFTWLLSYVIVALLSHLLVAINKLKNKTKSKKETNQKVE